MIKKYSRIIAVLTACILIFTILSLAGVNMNMADPGEEFTMGAVGISKSTANEGESDQIWIREIPIQTPKSAPSEQPWWEITSRDSNRNRIVDSLEFIDDDGDDDETVPIIVSYSRPVVEEDVEALKNMGIPGGYVVKAIDAISIGLTDPVLIPDLASLPGVVMIERSGEVHLYSDVATRAIKARGSAEYSPESAWEYTNVSGYGINVAVVDTGIDDGHPSLDGKRVAGYDAVTPESRTDGQTNPDDRNGHGTSCSGMATGTSAGDPELRYMGSAPGARLVDVQIGTDIGAGPFENYLLPTTYYDSALRGIEWVRDNANTEWSWVEPEHYGIDIQSLSWGITSHESGGSDGSDPFSRLIDEVVDKGIVSVGAAGNDGPNNDGLSGMSASSKAIIVGATDDHNTIDRTDDTIAGYSSRGPRKDNNDGYPYDELKPDVSAPGTDIWNTDPCTTSEGCYGDAEGHGYEARGSGTSYATPAVAGVVALILDVNGNLTPAQVTGVLHQTSERRGPATFPDLDPFWNRDFGYGMVDAYEAVKLAMELNDLDVDAIDVELQAHITNVTEDPSGSGAVLEGLAWAKIGIVERVEVSIDGGSWNEVEYLNAPNGTLETGEFLNWKFEVKSSDMSGTGNHTAWVRAVNGEQHSIHDSATFYGKGSDKEDDGMDSFKLAIMSSIVLSGLLILAALVIRKKDLPEQEIAPENVEWEE